jgi:hypothetical protein
MTYFDFTDEIHRSLAEAKDEPTKWSVRTTVGRQLFPRAVELAGFRFLPEGSSLVPASFENVLVIGIATWSDPELRALEKLAPVILQSPAPVFVYDIDDWSLERIQDVMPGATKMLGTPIVAQYTRGRLSYFGYGDDAMRWLDQFR